MIGCPNCGKALPPLLLNVSETGAVLGLSRWSVQAMLRRFELAFVPRGRKHKRVPLWEVLKWIESHTVRSAEDLRVSLDGRRKGSASEAGKARKAGD